MTAILKKYCKATTVRSMFLSGTILFASGFADAAPFTVNTLVDTGDGVCDVVDCSLRDAINSANAGPGADTINFTVTGTINLFSALPNITDDLTITGPGADQLTVQPGGGSPYTIFTVTTAGAVNFSGLSIRNAEGGIFGGGLYNFGGASVTLTACVVSNNSSLLGSGGGIYNDVQGTLTISDSTISGNSAIEGGGIFNRGTANIVNSTISGNSATQGGGIATTLGGHAGITNSTIANNFASLTGGGAMGGDLLGTILKSTIVAGNSGPSSPDLLGTFISQGFNIFGSIDGATINLEPLTDRSGINSAQLNLGLLQHNGGPTMTHALGCGSVAIDKGINALTLLTDQRRVGFPRTIDDPSVVNANGGDGTDVGSFERVSNCVAPPTVTTSAANNVLVRTATLNGTANPNGGESYGWFRYSTADPGTCDDTFGTRVPEGSSAIDLGAGTSPVPYSQPVLSLTPGTTYYYCAIASNFAGMHSFGSVLSFTMLPSVPPTVTTTAATNVTATAATLNGTANPNGDFSHGWFRYAAVNPGTCDDSFGTKVPEGSSAIDLGSGTSVVPYSHPLPFLTPGTTYYYCAIASNFAGAHAFGSLLSFTTTGGPPTVTTSAATNVIARSATLNGVGNANGAESYAWFRYSTVDPGMCNDTFGTRIPAGEGFIDIGAGTSPVPFSRTVTGLIPATTYYYCAYGSNFAGMYSFGSVLSFTTLPAQPPTVLTLTATNVTATSATLNGSANPNGDDSFGYFRYSTVNPGACNDTFGTQAPAGSASIDLGSGTSVVPYSHPLPFLIPGTTYYYCAIAANFGGVSVGFGSVLSFTTTGGPPTVTTSAATNVIARSATLNGVGNANGAESYAWFRYATVNPGTCNDTFGTRIPAGEGFIDIGSGTSPVPFSRTLAGLIPGTTYYYCAYGSNFAEMYSFGSVLSFTTLPAQPPTVATAAATNITATSATLNGSANPNGDPSFGYFRYSTVNPGTCNDTFGTQAPAGTASIDLGSGTSVVPYSHPLPFLIPATTYYYCAIAANFDGVSVGLGSVVSFTTTGGPPTVATSAATNIAATSVTLNGVGNANGAESYAWFRYATVNPGTCNDSFGTRIPEGVGFIDLGAGASAVPFSRNVTGLIPGTTYYYCAYATNFAEMYSFGSVLSFTTTGGPPTMTTSPATNVTPTSATLNGIGNPNGSQTDGWFRYSTVNPGTCNDTFGTKAPVGSAVIDLGAGTAPVPYSQAIVDLIPGATYYYCTIALNTAGMSFGSVVSFGGAASDREVRFVGGWTTPGNPVTSVVELDAQGDENAIGFSLDYDGLLLSNPQVTLASGLPAGATLFTNTATDNVGVIVALPAGSAFPAGTRQLVNITFATVPTSAQNTPVVFADVPVLRQVVNANADTLPVTWTNGSVLFAQGFEADLITRPTGDGSVTVADLTLVGSIVAGTIALNPDYNEFQRADSAPRSSLGDGVLSVADYTQAGRYAAALDPTVPAGGPGTSSSFGGRKDAAAFRATSFATNVTVTNAQAGPGAEVTVAIMAAAQGIENGFGFSLEYDAAKLQNPVLQLGADVPAGTTFIPNTNTPGHIGIILARGPNQTFVSGNLQLLTVKFTISPAAPGGPTAVALTSDPVIRQISDVNAEIVEAVWTDGTINILAPTAAPATVSGRVVTASGEGIGSALVTITDSSAEARFALTNPFGYYRFDGVATGRTYIVFVSSKRYTFPEPSRVISVVDDLFDVDFIASP